MNGSYRPLTGIILEILQKILLWNGFRPLTGQPYCASDKRNLFSGRRTIPSEPGKHENALLQGAAVRRDGLLTLTERAGSKYRDACSFQPQDDPVDKGKLALTEYSIRLHVQDAGGIRRCQQVKRRLIRSRVDGRKGKVDHFAVSLRCCLLFGAPLGRRMVGKVDEHNTPLVAAKKKAHKLQIVMQEVLNYFLLKMMFITTGATRHIKSVYME